MLIIGVSGGVDSMVLLHLCHRLGAKITVVHVNYGLRGQESDDDEALVRETCMHLEVACYVISVDPVELKCEGVNLQQRAREIRYEAYVEYLAKTQSDYILTGHHLDDSIETAVINFFRGTDIQGLTGISDWGQVRRPLITFTKSEIIAYAREQGITYRDDKSNATDDYTRNRIRNTLLPQLDEIFPNIQKRLSTTISNLQAIKASHQSAMTHLLTQSIVSDGDTEMLPFGLLDDDLEEQLLIYWGHQYRMSRAQMQNLFRIRNKVGKMVESVDYKFLIDREGYLLHPKTLKPSTPSIEITEVGFNVLIPESQLTLTDETHRSTDVQYTMNIEKDNLIYPLTVRYWIPGDRIVYHQSPRLSKKLKKLFNDHKIRSTEKRKIPLLVNGDGAIIWVVGILQNPEYLGGNDYSISVIGK